jgi:sigma-B regulation protein RsbU (phosphoserine phosphatase)
MSRRDRLYLIGFLLLAGFLLFLGRNQLPQSVVEGWGLTLAGTSTVAVLLLALYRFRLALQASRLELARQEAELGFALKVQQALFPQDWPTDSGLDFSATCIPARGISGDYYDIFKLPDGRLVFAIADISGKGISAAILMASLQALLRAVVPTGQSPSDVCKKLSDHLHGITDASRFATFFYAEWHRSKRLLSYVNAGHNPPFLLNNAGCQFLSQGGIPLGIMPDSEFETAELTISPGNMLVLYSDGITEAGLRYDEAFGEERLVQLVAANMDKPLPEIQSRVLGEVRTKSKNEPEDDMTLVLARATEN